MIPMYVPMLRETPTIEDIAHIFESSSTQIEYIT